MKGKGTIFALGLIGLAWHWLSGPATQSVQTTTVQQVQVAPQDKPPSVASPAQPTASEPTPSTPLPLVQTPEPAKKKITTSARASIIKSIIEESIAEYPGPCACPYNRARNGSACGKRSAYSKPGGYDPICYAKDVSPSMIEDWIQSHGQNSP